MSTAARSRPIRVDDLALRSMRESDVRADRRIKKAAFRPRNDGRDRAGLSVSISDPEYFELHRKKYARPDKVTASILVSRIQEIGLDVVDDPDAQDPRHALIVGIPDVTLGDAEKASAERFAQLLAERATVYSFPSSASFDSPSPEK